MVLVVTSNSQKFEQIKEVLQSVGISTDHYEMKMKEHGDSIEEIVKEKAKQAFEKLEEPLIVDDEGTFFREFKEFPGTHSKRIYEAIGYEGIFRLLEGKNRDAVMRTIICYTDGSRYEMFEGRVIGRITNMVYSGAIELPYARIFIPDGYVEVMSMMDNKKIREISHRAIAVRKFANWFKEIKK